MNREKVRDKIAQILADDYVRFEGHNSTWEELGDRILAIPNLLVKAEDQTLPPIPRGVSEYSPTQIYHNAQDDMLRDGWMKCEVKE